jgi:hypothetical protein
MDRYIAESQPDGTWRVRDTETSKFVRPSAADPFEIRHEDNAVRFAALMSQRATQRR